MTKIDKAKGLNIISNNLNTEISNHNGGIENMERQNNTLLYIERNTAEIKEQIFNGTIDKELFRK
jgi:hypothetical protein